MRWYVILLVQIALLIAAGIWAGGAFAKQPSCHPIHHVKRVRQAYGVTVTQEWYSGKTCDVWHKRHRPSS
jgi:hypothetical protein